MTCQPPGRYRMKSQFRKKSALFASLDTGFFFKLSFLDDGGNKGLGWYLIFYISEQIRIVLLFISCSNCYLQLSSLFLKVDTEGFRSYQVPLSYLSSTSQTTYLSTNYQLPDLITFRYFNATFYILQLQTV